MSIAGAVLLGFTYALLLTLFLIMGHGAHRKGKFFWHPAFVAMGLAFALLGTFVQSPLLLFVGGAVLADQIAQRIVGWHLHLRNSMERS